MSNESQMVRDIQRFFQSFCIAFSEFDGALIAQRYLAPYSSLSADGLHKVLSTHEQIGKYFQGFLDKYREQGCHSCSFKELQVVPMGIKSALASVTWELHRLDHHVVSTWRESYNLTYSSGELRVYASTDHAEVEQFHR